jgi:hypothetical protein
VTDQPTDAGTDVLRAEGAPSSLPGVAVATPELEEVWARALESLSTDQLSPQHRAWVGWRACPPTSSPPSTAPGSG